MFPRAIPLLRAGYIRVTHPCAGRSRIAAGLPLDLHVLGLPLALILSQDQTLHCKMYKFESFKICYNQRKTLGYLLLGLLQSFKELYLFFRLRGFFFQFRTAKVQPFLLRPNFYAKKIDKNLNTL